MLSSNITPMRISRRYLPNDVSLDYLIYSGYLIHSGYYKLQILI